MAEAGRKVLIAGSIRARPEHIDELLRLGMDAVNATGQPRKGWPVD